VVRIVKDNEGDMGNGKCNNVNRKGRGTRRKNGRKK
jgi:hypothetical protein